jgi:peptide/nickel transport system substrate-binding protein
MAYAVDREVMLEKVYFGNGEVATGPISRALGWAYNPGELRYTRDVTKANKLLDEAGYPRDTSGVRFPLSIVYDTAFAKLAEVLRDQFGAVGIELQLKLMERNAWIDSVYKHWEFDLTWSSKSIMTYGDDAWWVKGKPLEQ